MSNKKPHRILEYHEFNGADFESQVHKTSKGIFGNNPPFTSPPITQLLFEPLVENVHNTYEAYKEGGQTPKGPYLIARGILITALNSMASYVDEMPGLNEALITLACFKPTKVGDAKAVIPGTPVVDKIERGDRGVLEPQCEAVPGAIF